MLSVNLYKECRRCGETKAVVHFHLDRTKKDGHSPYCKDCKCGRTPKQKRKRIGRSLETYGLSITGYALLFAQQDGKCAVCGASGNDSEILVVDHCHASKKVRGLLCKTCNSGLGFFKDNPNWLLSAASYLAKSRVVDGTADAQ